MIDGDRGKNYPTEADFEPHGHTLFLNASNVTIDGFLFDTNQFITEEKSNSMGSGKIIKDDIIITSRGSLGHIAWYNDSVQQVMPHLRINSGMLILRNKANVKTSYLHQFMKSDKGKAQIVFMSFGSAQPQLTKKGVESFTVNYPIDTEEQIKIGAFFSKLDNTITLQQRKLNSLQKLKKGLLQKMFPKNGENIPEIRFPEFSDAWKQRKLGDILKLLKDGTHGSHKDVTNGHYLLSAKNIKDGRIFWDKTDRIISDEDYKKIHSTFKINKGDVLLTIVGSIGETAIFNVSEEITFQRSVAILRPIDEVSSDFLYSEITSPKFQKFLNLNKSTSAQPGIYLGDLANISFSFPENKEEQKMIGRLFTGLNSTITLQQRKLESLQKLKKGLLQQMFI